MARTRPSDILLLALLAAFLLAGTWHLMALRFRSGDVYPPYSSLRSDPLGCKVLYDTFDHISSLDVRRHYSDLGTIQTRPGDTVMILGLGADDLDSLGEDLDQLAAGATRVVVSLQESGRKTREQDNQSSVDSDAKDEGGEGSGSAGEAAPPERKGGQWDLGLKLSAAIANSSGRYTAVLSTGSVNLPETISVSSPVYFHDQTGKWQEVYSLEEGPVMIQREVGQGRIVLISDSYPVSNEALRWELYPRLFSWILSETRNVIFVESHLGVRETRGIMSLVKRYRLIPLLSCIAVIVLLVVWKMAVPLAPVPDTAASDEGYIISEKDQFTGLVSLLGRNISSRRVVGLCLTEWRKSHRQDPGGRGKKSPVLKNLPSLDDAARDPVKTYNRINKILNERLQG